MHLLTWCHRPLPYVLNHHHNRRIYRRGPCAPGAASGGRSESSKVETLRSLDLVLGSRDEEAGQESQIPAVKYSPRVPAWAWSELREPRVFPVAANALYYTVLLVSVGL